MDDEELDANENEDNLEETEESTEEQQQGPNPEKAKDEVKKNIDRAKKTKEAMQKAQKAKKTAETAKKVKAAAKFASGAKKFALLANPYFWIALLIILAIIVLIGLIMSFTIMPSNFLGRCKKFVEGMMQGFCGFIWGDSTSPISNSSDDVKDLANYIQNMGYDIQGYGFGDVEYTNDTEKQRKEVQETNEAANAIDGKKNFVTEEQATQGGEIKKVYGLTAVTTVSSDQYKDGSEMFRITGRFSSKNNDYLRAYLSAEAATYTEATYSIKGFFNELGSSIIKGLSDIFGGNSSDDWKDPGDVGVKSKSTGMLNFTNSGGNNIFNSTLGGSPTKIKVDPKNKKLILYEHSLSIFGVSKIQWGQTFSVDLSNWTAIYGRPLELFLALHLSSMMPDLPYQMAVDQAFNTKVNINLEDVKIYFDTTITIDGHKFPIGNAAESLSSGSSQQHSHHTSSDMNRTDSSEYQIVDAEYVGDEKYFHSTMGGRDGYYVGKNLIYKGVTYEIWADAGSMCTRYAFAFLASAYSCNDLNYSQIVGTKDGSTNTKYNVPTGVFEKVWKNYANIEGKYYTSGADVKDVNTIVSNMSNALSNGLPVYLYSGYRSSQGFHAVNILGALSTGKLLMYCPYAGGVFEYGSSGNFQDNLRDLVSNADGYAVSSKYGRYVIGYFIPNSAPDGTIMGNGATPESSGSIPITAQAGKTKQQLNGMNYFQIIPENPTANMPLIVFLHGDGESSNFNSIGNLPITKYVESGEAYRAGKFIFIAPHQSQYDWKAEGTVKNVMAIIEKVSKDYRVDKSRIILTGMSRGGIGTWYIANKYPNYFAAIVPMSGSSSIDANNFKTTPVWAISGTVDVEVTYGSNMESNVNKINNAAGKNIAKMERIQGATHSTIQQSYKRLELFQWMLGQKGGSYSSIDTSKLMFIGDSWIYGTGYSYKIIPGQSYGVSPSNSNLVTGEYYYGWSGAGTWTFTDSNIQSYDNASAIVICLGLNCTASSEKSATDNASDMKRVIDLVKAKNPDKTIYITQTPHVGRNTGDTKDPVAWNRNIDAYNSVVKSLCDGTTVVFINPNDAITDSEGFLRDDYSGGGYHLSSDGYKAWYNKIIECINNGPVGENDDIDNLEEVLRYLSGENDPIKQRNYDEIRSAVIRDGSATLTLTDENGVEVTVTMSAEDLKAIRKLVNSGSNGASIKWPNIESVTNHWYYHIIDFYGTVDKNTPYGAYKKAKIAKKTINYKDEEGELDKYNIELTALLTSQNGIYYQVCEPYLNQRPSVYLRKIFHGVYYKYDGTTETARKISAARAIEAKYGTDNYNSDKFEKDPQKIVDKNITYNWHSTDSDSSKLSVTLEDATEYVNAKKAQIKIQKQSDALISIDNQEIEGADGVSASAEEFLNAAQEVTTYVKQNDFHYGDAHHMPPMANGATNSDGSKYISCDRLVAWALYKIGFKDQPQNGLVVSQIYDYCTNKGWKKITNSSEVQAGDIVLTGSSETDLVHTFICAGQNKRYDCGSDERIRLEGQYSGYTSQPFDEPISSNFVCAFRITGEVEPEETIDMSPEEAQQIIDKMGEDDGELEVNELGEESPMCKKLVDFKSNKSNSLEAFSLLENINSEAADVNYRLLKKLMIEMDYYSEDDMNSHEKNILLWVTNVEGVKGQDVADKIKANLGQTSETVYKTLSDTGRDANEYGIQISNFMDNTTVVCPGDAKVKSTGEDEHGEFIELELLTLSDEKQYPENGHMMLLHQDDEKNKYYNIETKYEDDPIYSAIDVLKRYRFRDTYQVFEADDVVGITMKISGLHNVKFHEGDSVLRGEIIADNPKNGVDEEDGKDGQKGDIIYVSMKKPDKTKIENVEDYIDPTYTYEDEKDMAEQLWYLDHPEYGNKYKTTSNKKVSDYEDGTDIIKGANNEETIWFTLIGIYGYSPEGAAAIMGNWYCESGFEPNNAQNTYNSSSGLSDEQITAMIDSGEISKDSFVNTAYGYGLAQWTYWSRKEAMYDYMKGKGLSIADLGGQIGFANTEMKNLNCYGELTSKDKSRDDIYHLTEVYHDEYERSAGRNIDARAQAALEIYDRNKDKQIPEHRGGYSGSSDIEYVQWAIDNMANDDHVGYNTPNPNDWKYSDTGSWDVDCSSMVYYALKETRYSEWGGTCEMGTANEPDMLSAKGFVQHEFHSIDELEPGDILWTRGTGRDGQYHHHTEIYVADGKNVGAHSNYDGEYGDSSGKEVNVQSCATYWRYYFREGR